MERQGFEMVDTLKHTHQKTMTKKLLILPYFGNLPLFFSFFLESVKANRYFDLILFTDQNISSSAPNLQIVQMSWGEMQRLIKHKLAEDIYIERPYKLIDYKPAYGHIFSEYIRGYDYWGHCDCDLIFGNLLLLEPYFEKGYERIGEYGHLIFYKNTEIVNQYFRMLTSPNAPSWDEVSHSTKFYCYDEHAGMNLLCEANNIFCTHPRLFDDILFYRRNFYSRRKLGEGLDNPRIPIYFEYDHGRLFRHYRLNNSWEKDESLYVHFQKRKMLVETDDRQHYLMIPNRFIPLTRDADSILKECIAPIFDINYAKIMLKFHIKKMLKYFKHRR